MRTILIQVEEENVSISFPTVGNLIDIESKKTALSFGFYRTWLSTPTMSSEFVLDCIDTVAHVETLCPEIKQKLGVKSLTDLPADMFISLVGQYRDVVVPWLEGFTKMQKDFYAKYATAKSESK